MLNTAAGIRPQSAESVYRDSSEPPAARSRAIAHARARTVALAAALACALTGTGVDAALQAEEIDPFVAEMVERHGFEAEVLRATLAAAQVSQRVLEAISRPAEAKPWHRYRPIFVTAERAAAGVRFWQAHGEPLRRAYERYGVPPEIVVAIIGVETFYGRHTGGFRVLDAIATLAFRYPKRSRFFRGELEQFLLLAREQQLSPMALTGSYAGAMGLPQFMPSSYRHYAVDFDGDGLVNIWDDPVDAIGSVANYLGRHGWQAGAAVALPARVDGARVDGLVDGRLETRWTLSELAEAGVEPQPLPDGDPAVNLVRLDLPDGAEYWVGLPNFYVITRYNRSSLYAMAVLQLAQEIRARYRAGG